MTAQENGALWDLRAEMQRAQVVCWCLQDQEDAPRSLAEAARERLRRVRVEYAEMCANLRTADR